MTTKTRKPKKRPRIPTVEDRPSLTATEENSLRRFYDAKRRQGTEWLTAREVFGDVGSAMAPEIKTLRALARKGMLFMVSTQSAPQWRMQDAGDAAIQAMAKAPNGAPDGSSTPTSRTRQTGPTSPTPRPTTTVLATRPTAELVPTGKLSGDERRELKSCEAVIAKNKQAFIAIGNALATIRDKRLWREKFSSFEAYCRAQWSFDGKEASDKIQAARRFELAAPIAKTLNVELANEGQLRALAGVDDPADIKAVVSRAARMAKSEGRQVFARDLAEARRREFMPAEDLKRVESRGARVKSRIDAAHPSPAPPLSAAGHAQAAEASSLAEDWQAPPEALPEKFHLTWRAFVGEAEKLFCTAAEGLRNFPGTLDKLASFARHLAVLVEITGTREFPEGARAE